MARILIIDDSRSICEAIKKMLEKEDVEIMFANTGQEGISLISKHALDLILLDINLPDIDGYKLCKYIKSNKYINHIPILFITGMDEIENLVKAFDAGATDYINKPFIEIELKSRIRAHLKTKQMYDKLQASNTRLKELVKENKKLAITDSLTSLYNRRYLVKHIDSVLKYNEASCIIMGDIDNFKAINDKYGHVTGDKVLINTSKLITQYAGDNAIVGRLGGEEFIIVLNDTKIHEATQIAEKIRRIINEEQVEYNKHIIKYTITFGVAELDFNEEIEENIKRADERMYRGKLNGKNCVINTD